MNNSFTFALRNLGLCSLESGEIQKRGHVSYAHTFLLLCSKTDSYCGSGPFADSSFVLSMLPPHHDK